MIPKEQGGRNERHLHLRGSMNSGIPVVRAETEAAEIVTESRKQTLNDDIKKEKRDMSHLMALYEM